MSAVLHQRHLRDVPTRGIVLCLNYRARAATVLTFEWDEEKAETNRGKHGVSFEEAKTVFGDPLSITVGDVRHSWNEHRYVDVGLSSEGRLLVVVYTERGEAIRLISSREATRAERKIYEEGTP